MREFTHSTGLLLVDASMADDNRDYAFKLNSGGTLVELYGWGGVGNVPTLTENEPMGDVTTVYVEDSASSRAAIAELVVEHKAKYGECRLFVWPETSDLARWVKNGMKEDGEEATSLDLGVSSLGQAAVDDATGPSTAGDNAPLGDEQASGTVSASEDASAADVGAEEVPDGTVAEIKEWVGDDPARAKAALEAEQAREAGERSTLVAPLESLAADEEAGGEV